MLQSDPSITQVKCFPLASKKSAYLTLFIHSGDRDSAGLPFAAIEITSDNLNDDGNTSLLFNMGFTHDNLSAARAVFENMNLKDIRQTLVSGSIPNHCFRSSCKKSHQTYRAQPNEGLTASPA